MPGDRQGLGLPPPMPDVPEPEASCARPGAAQVMFLCARLTCLDVQLRKLNDVPKYFVVGGTQLDGALRNEERGSPAPRPRLAALGSGMLGADHGKPISPDPNPHGQPALQLALQDQEYAPYDAMQLDPPLGGPPRGSPHVQAAAAMGEAAGGAAPAGRLLRGAARSAMGEAVKEGPSGDPSAGLGTKGQPSSQYRRASQQIRSVFWYA